MNKIIKFSSLGVKSDVLLGDKLPVSDVLDKTIIIHDVRFSKSKFERSNGSGERMQIEFHFKDKDKTYCLFTGSDSLMSMMKEAMSMRDDLFPLEATIVRVGKRFIFK